VRKYIFLTDEGFTQEPDGSEAENLQVLGIAGGADEEEALCSLMRENSWIEGTSFRSAICIEIKGDFKDAKHLSLEIGGVTEKAKTTEAKRAEDIIMKEYGNTRNSITPDVLEYGIIRENIAYELSSGRVQQNDIFGITLTRERPDGTTQRLYELCRFFDSEQKAREHITELKKRFVGGIETSAERIDLEMIKATMKRGDVWIAYIPKNLVDRINEESIREGNGNMFANPAELGLYISEQLEGLLYYSDC
jgi:hypothetical protein